MERFELDESLKNKVNQWLTGNYDEQTKQTIRNLLENNPKELIDAFYKDLEFGTGGLRGIMGVGSNRMNKYTVGAATQGLANYLLKNFKNKDVKVAIAHDCRNNSKYFSQIAADVLSGNGIKVYLFDDLRPTPELSFTIRELQCQSGIVITASHNPKEYNGYKVYWEDGAQLINPHDKNVVNEAAEIKDINSIKFNGNNDLIEIIGDDIDTMYIERLKTITLSPEIIKKYSDIKIVYTPIHGTGVKLAPMALRAFGFNHIIGVEEQNIVSGDFPTVHSPNPEEPAALSMAIQKAITENAELVMATDPDADRVGIAVRNTKGDFILLNGNQTAAILIYYVLTKWQELNKLDGKQYICKTIVTTELLRTIANKFNIETFDVLTGFKYIASLIRDNEGKKQFIGGGEESYGYLFGEFVRDKDAIMSCCMIAETAAWAKSEGKTLYEVLLDIYSKFGYYKEGLRSLTRKGKEGAEEIKQIMENLRNQTKKEINNIKVIEIKDYLLQKSLNVLRNNEETINLPKSDVIQYVLEDETIVTVRPSGTEPKIKFYFAIKENLSDIKNFEIIDQKANQRIASLANAMNAN